MSSSSSRMIPVPNDGPLLHVDDSDSLHMINEAGMKEARQLLLITQNAHLGGDDGADADTDAHPLQKAAVRLLRQLRHVSVLHKEEASKSADIRQQLRALQAFRSSILHHFSLKENNCKNYGVMVGVYRILLELCLSTQTRYNPMRRALHSCLSALQSFENIQQVDRSILFSLISLSKEASRGCWSDPIHSLFELLSYPPTKEILFGKDHNLYVANILEIFLSQAQSIHNELTAFSFEQRSVRDASSSIPVIPSPGVLQAVDRGILIVSTLKLLLTFCLNIESNEPQEAERSHALLLQKLQDVLLIPVLQCRATHGDGLSIAGVTYGQTLVYSYSRSLVSSTLSQLQHTLCDRVVQIANKWIHPDEAAAAIVVPPLNTLAVIRGLSATLPDSILCMQQSEEDAQPSVLLLSNPLGLYIMDLARYAMDAAVRLSALRGLDTLLGRACAIWMKRTDESQVFLNILQNMADQTLEVVMVTWESPPNRQVGSAIPSLFQTLVQLLQALPQSCTDGQPSSMNLLVKRVMNQPHHRKGRYIALEQLLPITGAKALLKMGADDLIPSLVKGIGDSGNNAGAIADFLGKLLSRLREEMNSEAGVVPRIATTKSDMNKKRRRQVEQEDKMKQKREGDTSSTMEDAISELLPDWIQIWAPCLAHELLTSEITRRNQIASFCLPLIIPIVGGPVRQVEASHAFAVLLEELQTQYSMCTITHQSESHTFSGSFATSLLWGKLEIIRHASIHKLTKSSSLSQVLRESISKNLPLPLLKTALVHSLSYIRVTAFSSIEAVIPSHRVEAEAPVLLQDEVELWKEYAPYAFKTSEKEYISKLLNCLTGLLMRLLVLEADGNEFIPRTANKNDMTLETKLQSSQTSISEVPSMLCSFVNDFVIADLIFGYAAYPGTVADKESPVVALLESILAFATEDEVTDMEKRSQPTKAKRKKNIPRRRMNSRQLASKTTILIALLSSESFAGLLSLMNSMWDRTRSSTFDFMYKLVHHAHMKNLPLPQMLVSEKCRKLMKARALFLSSSPRQREADTGARMLATLFITLSDPIEQGNYLNHIVSLIYNRIGLMEDALGVFLTTMKDTHNERGEEMEHIENKIPNGRELPLAHGLLQGLRLIVEYTAFARRKQPFVHSSLLPNDPIADSESSLYSKMIHICCRSIEVSLAVVADFKSPESEAEDPCSSDKNENELIDISNLRNKEGVAPLNINTGAIGANSSSTTTTVTDKEDNAKRVTTQRVVMGSWLLTKEACATLASVVFAFPLTVPSPLIATAGSLLISTLTSIKHQGAAFAAHKALQRISECCNDSNRSFSDDAVIRALPSLWAERLLHEISSAEIVRDSTLRRSTGYSLGFLSIMRSEPPSGVVPRTICPHVFANIIRLSLPPTSLMKHRISCWESKLHKPTSCLFTYSSLIPSTIPVHVSSEDYQWRTRVHALNVLRLTILDAPLASDMRRFVGDSIVSALIGYEDESWAVRNSATMVFAAAMLRVIDADKNASSKASTSGNLGSADSNAITARELFLTYPHLSSFLLSIINDGERHMQTLHPSSFPLLLLLSRLQPAEVSLSCSDTTDVTHPFVAPVLECLAHRHHKVRIMAARSLSVLCTGDDSDDSNVSSRSYMLNRCQALLEKHTESEKQAVIAINWNLRHGALLAIQALVRSSPDPLSTIRGHGIHSALSYYASWFNGTCGCPPSCVAIGLETLMYAYSTELGAPSKSKHGSIRDEDGKRNALVLSAYKIIRIIEKITQQGGSLDLIDLAGLGASVGAVACKLSFQTIFDLKNENDSLRYVHIDKVASLICSCSYDVRLAAVKSFKKSIYTAVDSVLNSSTVQLQRRVETLQRVSAMLLKSMTLEMNRGIGDNQSIIVMADRIGPHPPTMRRLSRCAIETLTALRSMNGSIAFDSYDIVPIYESWILFQRMRLLGGCHVVVDDGRGGNRLSGNALELMGFALSQILDNRRPRTEIDQNEILHRVSQLVLAVKESTDPLSSWHVRHSAAVGIDISGILKSKALYDQEKLESFKLDLQMEALNLLQDNDLDVRRAAGRALQGAGSIKDPMIQDDLGPWRDAMARIPLLDLEQTYHRISDEYNGLEWTERLFRAVLDACQDMEGRVQVVLEEFKGSEAGSDSMALLNLGTKRKIFEGEDPNPFEEPLIISQLAVVAISKEDACEVANGDLANEVLTRCAWILELLKNRSTTDIFHDVSRCNNIFPAIHSLLLGSIVAIYIGNTDDQRSKVQDFAKDIITRHDSVTTTSIHPFLLEAMRVLSTANTQDTLTRKGLRKCCFLLPSIS